MSKATDGQALPLLPTVKDAARIRPSKPIAFTQFLSRRFQSKFEAAPGHSIRLIHLHLEDI